jgi:hypothetical protein
LTRSGLLRGGFALEYVLRRALARFT